MRNDTQGEEKIRCAIVSFGNVGESSIASEDYAREMGWTIVQQHEINPQTQSDSNSFFSQLLTELDVIVVSSLGRLLLEIGSLERFFYVLADLHLRGIRVKELACGFDSHGNFEGNLALIMKAWSGTAPQVRGYQISKGLGKTKADGKSIGRPRSIDESEVRQLRSQGKSLQAIAAELGISKRAVINTLQRAKSDSPEL